MTKLAKQFQLSDNGLRKICKKHDIPMPEAGHWQKLQFGKRSKKIPMPSSKSADVISISTTSRQVMPEPSKVFTETIVVPDQIKKFHPLIIQTKQLAVIRKNSVYGSTDPGLDIYVSSGQLSRAYRIMDTIIKALEERGAQVGIDADDPWKRPTYVLIDGEKVHFGLREYSTIHKKEPDPKQPWASTRELVPNGRLELSISDYLDGLRSKWTDREKHTLEKRITPFINGLWIAAAQLKKRRLAREDENRQREEARQAHVQRLKALEEEKRRIQALEQQVSSWKKSREIRSFIRTAIKKQGAYAPDSEFAKWVAWATSHADQLDPLR